MSTNYVSETAAGKSISAFVILNRRGKEVATVRAHFSNSGRCLVNVFNYGEHNRSAKERPFQKGAAGGYGYDKFTAALSGLEIDGHELTNHCARSKPAPKPFGVWPRDAKAPKGWYFANWRHTERVEVDGEFITRELPKEQRGWADCYKAAGLDYLRGLGYRVITAI